MTINGEAYDLERMNFAKRLCSDDANLIEVVEINATVDDEDNDIINGILRDNRFDVMYRKQVEQMSANGTVGAYVKVDNAEIMDDGTFRGGDIKIQYCDTLNIIPLTVINDEIIEVAFVGQQIVALKKCYTLVLFTYKDGKYYASSFFFDEFGVEKKDLMQMVELGNVKPFAIMRTAEYNNLDMRGYGYPKLWNAIPNLKTLDLSMTMWNRDLEKSDKIILVNEGLMKHDEKGNIKLDPKLKGLFVQVGNSKLPDEKSMWQEYNPTVRMSEITSSIETALSILSLSFGYGTKKYTFETGKILTATEYVGERQDAMQEINKQRYESIQYITELCKAIAYFYEQTQGKHIEVDSVMVDFDDTYIEDKTALVDSMRNDALSFGIPKLQIWYFMKKYNLTEEEAKELLDDMPEQDDGIEELEE